MHNNDNNENENDDDDDDNDNDEAYITRRVANRTHSAVDGRHIIVTLKQ